MTRKIIHLDLDAFFCAVEERRNPVLRGKPFAVGGLPQERGVVASCSYPARMSGVRSAMPMARALHLCPALQIISADHNAYSQASRQVMQCLNDVTPLLEQISIDEAFLDVSDLTEQPGSIASHLQTTIRRTLDLPCSLGTATNKLVAKIANDFGKSQHRGPDPPNAITVVQPGEEAAFLAPLPVIALWGVGPKTAARLEQLGILTIGQLSAWPESELIRQFGKNGRDLHRHALGLDDSPVITTHDTKSISQEVTFSKDINDPQILYRTLRQQAEKIAWQLRHAGLLGKTIKLKLRWPDFTTLTRQTTLKQPTDLESDILLTAEKLFEANWADRKPVRLIGIGVSGLEPDHRQLSLWETPSERSQRLQSAIDDLQNRFGKESIHRGLK
jgi:DNA polymerase IV